MDSDFRPITAGSSTVSQFNFTVTNATSPLWFYCRQTGYVLSVFLYITHVVDSSLFPSHCGMGMVFAVNPTQNKSFEAFQKAARATANSTSTNSISSSSSVFVTSSASIQSSSSPTSSGASSSVAVASSPLSSPSNSDTSSSPAPSSSGSANSGSHGAPSIKMGSALIFSGLCVIAGLIL